MDDLTLEQIMLILTALIDDGRITIVDGKLFVDNTLAMDPVAADVVEPTPSEFDQFGISIETSEFGGVSLRYLDERLELDRASNDPLVARVATAFPQFFFMHIDRGLSIKKAWHNLCSYNKQSFLSGMFGGAYKTYMSSAYKWSPVKYVNKEKDDTQSAFGTVLQYQLRLTDAQHFSKEWKTLNSWYHTEGKLENYLTYSMGVISGFYEHPKYESEYLAKANERAIMRYEQVVAGARRQEARAGSGSIPPSVGPRK